MSWHHSEGLHFLLVLLTGFAALLAVAYVLFSRRRKSQLLDPRPWTLIEKGGDLSPPPKHPPSPFGRLCESTKDLPPKVPASLVREHFGVFGGVQPSGTKAQRIDPALRQQKAQTEFLDRLL